MCSNAHYHHHGQEACVLPKEAAELPWISLAVSSLKKIYETLVNRKISSSNNIKPYLVFFLFALLENKLDYAFPSSE